MDTERTTRRTSLWRAAAVLALAGIVGGILAAGPAGAAKFLTKRKAHKLFLTPAEGNAAYLNVGEGIESTVFYRRGPTSEIPAGSDDFVEANCPVGTKAVGGGAFTEAAGMSFQTSIPSDGTTGALLGFTAWTTWVDNPHASGYEVTPYVVCVKAAATDADFSAGEDPLDQFT